MTTLVESSSMSSSSLPPPPMVMDDTAQLLETILGDDDDEYDYSLSPKDKETLLDDDDNHHKHDPSTNTTTSVIETELVSDEDEYESDEYESSEEEEEVVLTTMEEKQSLLALAAEHDRVDILQAILEQEESDGYEELLNPTSSRTPLSIACQFQSTNATSCLLRLGAKPQKQSIAEIPSHALEAETLRAIGADEWDRLNEFLLAGLDTSTFTIANRSLLDWCHDMNATTCLTHLTPPQPQPQPQPQHQEEEEPPSLTETQPPSPLIESNDSHNDSNNDNGVEKRRKKKKKNVWEDQLEESEALAAALSQLLDSLAEEVSVTQGLLYNKNALLSHIAAIKTTRATKEDQLQEWQHQLSQQRNELQMVTDYWYNATHPESDDDDDDDDEYEYEPILPLPQPTLTPSSPPLPNNNNNNNNNNNKEEKHLSEEQWKELLECSQLRIAKLRSSITDLADEKARDMNEIERLGLTGAVHLAQSLRDEVQSLDQQLEQTRSEAASTRLQIDTIRDALERLLHPPSNNTTPRSHPTPYLELEQSPDPSHIHPPNNNNNNNDDDETDTLSNDGAITVPTSTTTTTTTIPSSSQAVVPYVIRKGYLPLHLWDLILRIFGLGKRSVKKAVRDQLTITTTTTTTTATTKTKTKTTPKTKK